MAEPREQDREQAITDAKAWLIKHGFGYYMPTGSGLCPHVSAVMDLMRESRSQGRAEEREACARLAENDVADELEVNGVLEYDRIAKAIRARGAAEGA